MGAAVRACSLIGASVAASCMTTLLLVSPSIAAQRSRSPSTDTLPSVNRDTTAASQFRQRLEAYLVLRETLARTLKPLSVSPDAAELGARKEALAASLRSARQGARQGNLIPAAMAATITRIVAADFKRRQAVAERATLEEVPRRQPVINGTYPTEEALPTVPPLLLNALPQLPNHLQYRFYGRHVLVLDSDVQMIVDYVPNALPPH